MGWKITVISRIFCSTKNKVVTQKLHYFLGKKRIFALTENLWGGKED